MAGINDPMINHLLGYDDSHKSSDDRRKLYDLQFNTDWRENCIVRLQGDRPATSPIGVIKEEYHALCLLVSRTIRYAMLDHDCWVEANRIRREHGRG